MSQETTSFADSSSSHSLLSWLLQTEAALSGVPLDDDYGLYELLHCASERIAKVDACLVSLYRESDQTIFFPYNFDGGLYDEPLTIAIGNGPTAWVLRHHQPFVLTEENRHIQDGNINFGEKQRASQSAIHVPIMTHEKSGEVLGTFSIQSYEKDVYNEEIVSALQLLCVRAAQHMEKRNQYEAHEREVSALRKQVQAHQAHKISISNRCVELSNPLTQQIQELSRFAKTKPLSPPTLQRRINELCRLCFKLQTEVSLLPFEAPPSAEDDESQQPANPLQLLTKSERDVLELLARGASNKQIAVAIDRTLHTVKQHCKLIYKKLDVANRTEAARLYERHANKPNNSV